MKRGKGGRERQRDTRSMKRGKERGRHMRKSDMAIGKERHTDR